MILATTQKQTPEQEAEENLLGFLTTLIEIDQEQNKQQSLFATNPDENND